VVIITDGQLEPAEIIDSAGKVSVPIAPIPDEQPTSQPTTTE